MIRVALALLLTLPACAKPYPDGGSMTRYHYYLGAGL